MCNSMDSGIKALEPASDWPQFQPKWPWFAAAMLLLILAVPAPSQGWEMYIQCSGGGIGNLNSGDLSVASVGQNNSDLGHEDWGGVKGYWEAAQVPMDMNAANPGNREHAGISIVKMRSKSSPLYMQALVNKTQLQCTIEFWIFSPPSPDPLKFYSIGLANARIASIELNGTTGNADETVTFHAEQISWTHHQASTTFSDNLISP